jgi:hypothetical protein
MNKYRAKRINTPDGIFDSIGEYKHWQSLKAISCDISNDCRPTQIERQVVYRFIVNGILIGKYVADFVLTYSDGMIEVQDFKNPYLLGKGKSTPAGAMFQYKRKLMKALHNIEIKIITNGNTKNNESKRKRATT